jgi:hypothetical protein
MGVPKNLFAYTALPAAGVSYPEYLSINRVDGRVQVTVRAAVAHGGVQAMIELPDVEFDRMARELFALPIDYAAKCKRRRTDGPTPCLCCPGECTGGEA